MWRKDTEMITLQCKLELKSSDGDLATRKQTSGKNNSVRGLSKGRRKSWRVLQGSPHPPFTWEVLCEGLPILEKSIRSMGEEDGRTSSCSWCRDYGWSKTARWGRPSIKRRITNTPPRIALRCSSVN